MSMLRRQAAYVGALLTFSPWSVASAVDRAPIGARDAVSVAGGVGEDAHLSAGSDIRPRVPMLPSPPGGLLTLQSPEAQFAELDRNRDGRLDPRELNTLPLRSGNSSSVARFRGMDTDGDGRISPAEYQASRRAKRLDENALETLNFVLLNFAPASTDVGARPHSQPVPSAGEGN